MTQHKARHTINTEGRFHALVIYFIKRSGGSRRMVCRYTGRPSRSLHLMLVWDLEKGAWRYVNLSIVHEIKVITSPRKDRSPARRFEEARTAVWDLLF